VSFDYSVRIVYKGIEVEHGLQDGFGMGNETSARVAELDFTSCSDKEGGTEVLFKLTNALAKGCRGKVHPPEAVRKFKVCDAATKHSSASRGG